MELTEMKKIVKDFSEKCKELGNGEHETLEINNLTISVYRDGDEDPEFNNLFDIHTKSNITSQYVDDICGIYIDDLLRELQKIAFNGKVFETL